jgi:hypothetical protein
MCIRFIFKSALAVLHASGTLTLFTAEIGIRILLVLTERVVNSRAWYPLALRFHSRQEGQLSWCRFLIFNLGFSLQIKGQSFKMHNDHFLRHPFK